MFKGMVWKRLIQKDFSQDACVKQRMSDTRLINGIVQDLRILYWFTTTCPISNFPL